MKIYHGGIEYEDKKTEEIVSAIMNEKIGNLEWIVAHWVGESSEDDIKQYKQELKESKKHKRS